MGHFDEIKYKADVTCKESWLSTGWGIPYGYFFLVNENYQMDIGEFLIFSDVCHDDVLVDFLLCLDLPLPLHLLLLKQEEPDGAALPHLGRPQPSCSGSRL